jgi:ATP phosphoribosyltransferase
VPIRIALPKGLLLNDTARLAAAAGWELSDYSEKARLYLLSSAGFPDLSGKILHEKDIPVQVAMGNYDLGICGLDWIQELMVKYPGSALIKVKDLGYGALSLFLAASRWSPLQTLESLRQSKNVISFASEYPNLAESLALNCRFKRFNIFPVWGAAEIYPPENADLVLLSAKTGAEIYQGYLIPIARTLRSTAYLIANQSSWETKDLGRVINSLLTALQSAGPGTPLEEPEILKEIKPPTFPFAGTDEDIIRLALPDGHQQKHMVNVLDKAGIRIYDYPSESGNRRPGIDLPGVMVKVIRPQDMPLQVANRKFDIAVTGRDWVREHRYKFPLSPVTEMADLKYGRVRIVAAVHNDLPVNDIGGLRQLAAREGWRIRVAAEYVSIADKYARDNRLGMYRIIPTWGATEAFLPDDADLLIENTETGATLQRHNLKIIETLFESTACLIASTWAMNSFKATQIKSIAFSLLKAVQES